MDSLSLSQEQNLAHFVLHFVPTVCLKWPKFDKVEEKVGRQSGKTRVPGTGSSLWDHGLSAAVASSNRSLQALSVAAMMPAYCSASVQRRCSIASRTPGSVFTP